MQAVFETYIAARTDGPLGRALQPVIEHHRHNIIAEARNLFPELAAKPGLAHVVDAVVYSMQGIVIGWFGPDMDTEAQRQNIALVSRLARNEISLALSGKEPR
jgi:hypothetical protein